MEKKEVSVRSSKTRENTPRGKMYTQVEFKTRSVTYFTHNFIFYTRNANFEMILADCVTIV